jgi:hypothetical protein
MKATTKANVYTRIANSKKFNDQSMSLGFRRFTCLSTRQKRAAGSAYLLMTGSTNTHNYMVGLFGEMTEQEYKQYVLTH